MTKTLFTSDTHFGHVNMTDEGKNYSNRPYATVQQMDEAMIANWNAAVAPEDIIYHLGDFSMGKKPAPSYLERLNGQKHLIWGNHDSKQTRELPNWASSQPYLEINLNGKFIILCHYKFSVFNKSHRGGIQLFGHSHGSMPGNSQQIDVGVDCWDYKPVELPSILRKMNTLPDYLNSDHHGRS